ncbi:uncharacterized protein BJX67DRAFT_377703 [Aspergillus lucknowensis]|uniref:SnoaL-like domain-containing protein n=1 Tax=Aspergillus lucknowensis TaxID=176173 RepID=A0ABR4M3D8_9EURO
MSSNIVSEPSLSPPNASAMISFMESFYSTSDTESKHDAYVEYFTPDATLIMGPKTAKGTEEIRALRHGLWTHVASRKHTPVRIYFGAENELMLYGVVRYVLREDGGTEVEVPWAGRVVFEAEGERLRMKLYQVYLDPTAQGGKK